MKEGWRMVKLGEVCDICLGLTHTPKYVDKGIPFISVKDISQGELNLNNTKRISEDEFTNMPDGAKPRKGDVLFCRVGTIGKPQVLKLDEPFGIFVSVGFLRTKTNSLNTYLRHWMDSNLFMSQVEKNVQGSTLKNLNTGWLKNFTLPLPPLEEQHRIVSILDASFEKIDALKKNAEENLKNAKALFQQVLAQELKPKEGWVEKKLQDVCEIINGYAFPSSAFKKNNEVKVIKITNVGVGKFIKDDENKLPQHYLTNVEDVIINELDIVVALTRTIIAEGLKVAIVPKEYDGALLNQRVAALRMYPKVLLREYLYYYFQTKYAKEYVLSRVNTLMQPNLSIKDLRDMPIPYLPFETQHRIVRTLDTLSEKCRRLEQVAQQTILECDALKQSILRQAFSGEL